MAAQAISLLAQTTIRPAAVNATKIQDYAVKSPLGCSDGYVLTWVASNNRFECLVSAASSGAGGSNTQVQWNNNGILGATSGFTWTAASRLLAFGLAGSEGALRLPSLDSAFWHFKGTSSTINGVRDNLLRLGWNMDTEDATEPQWGIQLESHYYDTTAPASHVSEFHVAYTSAAGVGRRPIQINVFRQDNGDASYLANQVQVQLAGETTLKSSSGATTMLTAKDAGTIDLANSSSIFFRALNNNLPVFKQKRAGASTYSSLAQLDSNNVWNLSPDGEAILMGAGGGDVTVGDTTANYVVRVDKTNRKLIVGSGNVNDKGIRIVGGTAAKAQGIVVGDGTNEYTMARNASTSALDFTGTQVGKSYTFDAGVTVTGTATATTFSGSGASLTSIPGGQLTGSVAASLLTGTIADARLSTNVPLLNAVTNTFTGTVAGNVFSGSGASLTSLPAAQLTGTVADARLSSNVPLKDAANTFTGGLQTISSDAVNTKLKISHSVNGDGYGSQIGFAGGGSDKFTLGEFRAGGLYYFGLEDHVGNRLWVTPHVTRNVLIATDTTDSGAATAKLQVGGGIQWKDNAGGEPTCDAAHRFVVWPTSGGAGVKDTFRVCAKDAADAYAWRTIY